MWLTPNDKNKPGKAYMNFKKHKPEQNYPGRLITTCCGSFTENLSALTAIELKKRAHILPYIAIDTNHVLRKLHELNESGVLKGKNIIHVSWDVKAMFPNITKELGMKNCREELNKREDGDGLPTECVMEALEITLDFNVAEFDGCWYHQMFGAAMGPHHSCEYCDIAMSSIDNKVNSDDNPVCKLVAWVRFRDDIYSPWTAGIDKLIEFDAWLNTLDDNLKFEMKFSEEGVEYLETYIYDKDGVIHTKLFSKDSDTHAYLPPTSCHPYHVCKNNPNQVARRIRKLNSEEESYIAAKKLYSDHLQIRGYSTSCIEEAFQKFDNITPFELYNNNKHMNDTNNTCYPLVTEFNPHLPNVSKALNKHKHIIEMDTELAKILPPKKIFASFRQPKNIGNILIHSAFKSESTCNGDNSNPNESIVGCKPCNNSCILCKHNLKSTDNITSCHTDESFKIKYDLNCQSSGVIYMLKCIPCNRTYVGSTINSMATRWRTYRGHIKDGFSGCEIATHFSENHPYNSLLNDYNLFLKSHIEVTIIDQVELSDCVTKQSKRKKLEGVEGYWQTQLRTLLRYGGLNKKDERKITNNRNARQYIPIPPIISTVNSVEYQESDEVESRGYARGRPTGGKRGGRRGRPIGGRGVRGITVEVSPDDSSRDDDQRRGSSRNSRGARLSKEGGRAMEGYRVSNRNSRGARLSRKRGSMLEEGEMSEDEGSGSSRNSRGARLSKERGGRFEEGVISEEGSSDTGSRTGIQEQERRERWERRNRRSKEP